MSAAEDTTEKDKAALEVSDVSVTPADGNKATTDTSKDDIEVNPTETTKSDDKSTTEPNTAEGGYTPLPEYKADDPEVLTAYDNRFFTDSGELNMDELSAEWDANDKTGTGTEGTLSEGTYKYLQDRLGVTKDYIKRIEAGQVALNKEAVSQLYTRVGGEDAYKEAIAWARGAPVGQSRGKSSGYSEAEMERFNTKIKAGGADREEALDALMARYARATGKTIGTSSEPTRRGPPMPRGVSPKRDVGSSSSGSVKSDIFADNDEYLKARFEAKRSKDPKAAMADVEAKLKRSTFWRSAV